MLEVWGTLRGGYDFWYVTPCNLVAVNRPAVGKQVSYSTLKTQVVPFFKTSANFYQTTRYNIRHLHTHAKVRNSERNSNPWLQCVETGDNVQLRTIDRTTSRSFQKFPPCLLLLLRRYFTATYGLYQGYEGYWQITNSRTVASNVIFICRGLLYLNSWRAVSRIVDRKHLLEFCSGSSHKRAWKGYQVATCYCVQPAYATNYGTLCVE